MEGGCPTQRDRLEHAVEIGAAGLNRACVGRDDPARRVRPPNCPDRAPHPVGARSTDTRRTGEGRRTMPVLRTAPIEPRTP